MHPSSLLRAIQIHKMSPSPPSLKILISGAGIAGPCLAYWLSRTRLSTSITIVERSPVPRATGQSIDIRGPAINVIKKMGLQDAVNARHTTEEGTRILNASGKVFAEFSKGDAFTAEYEILRADLCGLFLDSTSSLPNVQYRYGDYVTGLEQTARDVSVTFASNTKQTYDIVVGADGSTSKIRSMVLPKDALEGSYKPIGQYIAYFSIPSVASDTKHWYWYNTPDGLGLMTRPHRNVDTIGVYMVITTPGHSVKYSDVEAVIGGGSEAQKQVLRKYFANAGWEAKRILEGMDTCPDFYMSRAAQVKLPIWHSGRVVLLGDAAFATFGIGTSLAIKSAYCLAGELGKICSTDDLPGAIEVYEQVFRKVYKKSEDLLPGFPQIAFPQTRWGLRMRDAGIWLASRTKLYKLLPDDDKEDEGELSDYDWILPNR
jgi:2-polyprenyl-6-methoxyphenol hydroxylase-like FAD-dependent oxidoreductase